MKLNFTLKKGAPMVKKPHYTIVERTDHLATPRPHPYHTLIIRMRSISTSFDLTRRIVQAEEEVGPNVWSIFRRLGPQHEMNEDEVVVLMDQEIPGLGQVAQVFGTHEGPEGREENVWEILNFFMNVQMDLSQSPRLAWRDKKLRHQVLRLARLYGNQVAI